MQNRSSQPGFFRKLIVPALLIGAIIFFIKSGSSEDAKTNPNTSAQQVAPVSTTNTTLAANKLGIGFEYPTSWGQIDAESDEAATLLFNDACTGSDCDSLYIQKIANTSANYTQIATTIQSLTQKEAREGFRFYEDEDKKVVTAHKLFIDNGRGTLYTFEFSGPASNAQKFDTIVETFREVPVAAAPGDTAAVAVDPNAKPFKFQSCGDLANYAKEDFYGDFVAQLTKMKTNADPLSVKMFGSTALSVSDVKNGCYSSEGKIFIVLATGNNMHIFKYDIAAKTLAQAKKTNTWDNAMNPQEFGKRDGSVIRLKSVTKDDTCAKDNNFEYDYLRNTITYKNSVPQKGCPAGAVTPVAPTTPVGTPTATTPTPTTSTNTATPAATPVAPKQ